MKTYANPTTAPAGTRVYTVRGGFGADGTRVYATVTGYAHGGGSIGVRYDNGGTDVGPVAHKAWIVAEDETPATETPATEAPATEVDPRTATPEGRVTLALIDDPAVLAAERAVERAQRGLADAIRASDAALAAVRADENPATVADWYAAECARDAARYRLDAAKATLAMERANARRVAWSNEAALARAKARLAAEPAEPAAPARTCRDCGAPLEPNGSAWVDARPGDDGGTYDLCPERWDETTDTDHGHRPA